MREHLSIGVYESRSRSRSPPRRMAHFSHPNRDGEETAIRMGRYSNPYYRSPSQGKSVGPVYRTARSPSPPSLCRYGDYYKGNGVNARTLNSLQHGGRSCHDREDASNQGRQKHALTRGSSRVRDYECNYEYGEKYVERENSYKRSLDRGIGSLRNEYDLTVNRVSSANTGMVDSFPSRGYFPPLVGRSNEYGRVSDSKGNLCDQSFPSSGGRYDEARKFNSVSTNYPVRTSFQLSDSKRGSSTSGRRSVSDRNASPTKKSWGSDGYDSIRKRYTNDDGDYVRQKEINRLSLVEGDRDVVSFRSEAIKFQCPSTKNVRASENRHNELDHATVDGERFAPLRASKSIEEELVGNIWKRDAAMTSNETRPFKNADTMWIDEDAPKWPVVDSIDLTKFHTNRAEIAGALNQNEDTYKEYDNDDGNFRIDDLNIPYIPEKINFAKSYNYYGVPKGKKSWSKKAKKDIKKRLGGKVSNVKMRLGPIKNVKQRLGPLPNSGKVPKHSRRGLRPLPWLGSYEHAAIGDGDSSCSKHLDGGNEATVVMKTEPPEESESFKLMVHSAFLKFIKNFYDNYGNRKKYLEQEESGSFSCSVCGSSAEFVGVSSLAQHAFQSCKLGLRSEHLGFHKALCVLMGWKIANEPNAPWPPIKLQDSEASSAKDDIVIWPPVVFIHNSTITQGNADNRLVVSITQLRDVLTGVGIGDFMTNLSRGKAANMSVFVASFKGTLPGFGEAAKLDKLFAERQHGRCELSQVIPSNPTLNENENANENAIMSVLYGYLGTACDLEKLDFDLKKRCVVKSRKEIEAVAHSAY